MKITFEIDDKETLSEPKMVGNNVVMGLKHLGIINSIIGDMDKLQDALLSGTQIDSSDIARYLNAYKKELKKCLVTAL